MFDVIVIGGGVIGGSILRELTKYQFNVCLLEKESDVCMGQSKANSGIVHAGFDAAPNSLKAKFNVIGNHMMPEYAKQLGVKYKNIGSIVVAFAQEEMATLKELKDRGIQNGVPDLQILSQEELREIEPNISQNAIAGLLAPTAGIVCPYELTIASIGNAMDNGAELFTDFEVVSIEKLSNIFSVKSKNGDVIEGKIIINCAGLGAGKIAEMVGDHIQVGARKGEYILIDRESGDFVSHTLFFTPTKKGKGILTSPTVDGNILLGPTAEEQQDGNTDTSAEGMHFIIKKAKEMCEQPPLYNTITSFAGVRSYCERHDFIIEESQSVKGVIHCIGIESPGLTSAPAIAEYVVNQLVWANLPLKVNEKFNGFRKPPVYFKELTIEEKNEIIARDPSFGKIVCRCEQVTEGEILQAIRENPPAKDIDGVKRRTRSGMGRCQGGFCQPYVAELIAREHNIPFEKVTKKGKNSYLVTGVSK